MFKQWIVSLCNVNSLISLAKLIENKPYTKLNWTTVRLYHQLHGTGK
jgi:hypothetical protein